MALKFAGGKAVPTNPTEKPRVKAAMDKVEPLAREFKAMGRNERNQRAAFSMGGGSKVSTARF